MNWTEQGVKAATDTVTRYRQIRSTFIEMGITFRDRCRTVGRSSIVTIAEAPDDQTRFVAMLRPAGAGTPRTETLGAFSEQERDQVIQKMG